MSCNGSHRIDQKKDIVEDHSRNIQVKFPLKSVVILEKDTQLYL